MANHVELVAAGRDIVLASPQEMIDLDVEANGVPGYGSLLSVGAVTAHGETFYQEIKPTSDRYLRANHDFCEAHNLEHERLMDEGEELSDVMHDLRDWTNDVTQVHQKRSPVLAAFNASFDFPWVDLGFKESGIMRNPYGVAGFCIKSMAMALQPTTYDWRQTSKGRLPAEIVPPGDFTHNALEDAIYQQQIHFALVGALATRRG